VKSLHLVPRSLSNKGSTTINCFSVFAKRKKKKWNWGRLFSLMCFLLMFVMNL